MSSSRTPDFQPKNVLHIKTAHNIKSATQTNYALLLPAEEALIALIASLTVAIVIEETTKQPLTIEGEYL